MATARTMAFVALCSAMIFFLLVERPESKSIEHLREFSQLPSPFADESDGKKAPEPDVTVAEAEEFARKLERAYLLDDTSGFTGLIHWETIANRATQGVERWIADNLRRHLQTTPLPHAFILGLKSAVSDSGKYQLVRIAEEGGKRIVWFRLSEIGCLNYHRYTLHKNVDGDVLADSIFLLATGDYFHETIRRDITPFLAAERDDLSVAPTNSERIYIENDQKIVDMVASFGARNFDRAIEAYELLPEQLKNNKFFLLMSYNSSNLLNDDKGMAKSINRMRRSHPDDACIDMLLMDYFMLVRDPANALQCVNRIDATVGGDPYLDYCRANILWLSNDYKAALTACNNCLKQLSDNSDALYLKVDLANALQNFELTYESLNELEQRFNEEFEDLRTIPEYQPFLASEPGKKWLAEHGLLR